MKINHSLGVFAPSIVRRRKGITRRPPWYVEVPPDTVDIALLPRINRYERGGLRFHTFGSTQQKIADRLALFRDAMGEIEPGIAFTEEEMRTGLEEVMRERMFMIEESEKRSIQRYGDVKDRSNVVEESTPAVLDVEVVNLDSHAETLEEVEESSAAASDSKNDFEDDTLQGTPTDWLVRRLQQLDRARG